MLEPTMKKELNKMQIWRRTVRAVLVPLALVVLVMSAALPASAATTDSGSTTAQSTPGVYRAKPLSLNW
jgi:hypothetical protein